MGGRSGLKRLSRRENKVVNDTNSNKVVNDTNFPRDRLDEITKLSELNRQLIYGITNLRQEKAALLSDKINLEASVLQVKNEKIELESELTESKARTRDLFEEFAVSRHVWDSEKQKWEGIATELQRRLDLMVSEKELLSQKNRELCSGEETLKAQLNLLEFEFNEFKERTGKFEDERRLWNTEKRNMENSVVELRTNLELMASERGSLSKKNRELSIEVEFLKIQVNEYKQQAKFQQVQSDSTRSLLEKESKQSVLENGRLCKQVEQMKKRLEEVYDIHIKQVQEKEKNRMEFESLVGKKYRELEERHFDLLKENEEQKKMIESLQRDYASPTSKGSEDIPEKCLKSELHTELGAAKFKISRSKSLEEELLSTKSPLEEMKESASKGSKRRQPLQLKSSVIDQNGTQKNSLLTEGKSKLKQPLQGKLPAIQTGKQKTVDEKSNPNGVNENGKLELRTPKQSVNRMAQKKTPNRITENTSPKWMR